MSKYYAGQRVKHREYEIGVVKEVSDPDDLLVVDFSGSEKKFSIDTIEKNRCLYTVNDNPKPEPTPESEHNDKGKDDPPNNPEYNSEYLKLDLTTWTVSASGEPEIDSEYIRTKQIIFRLIDAGQYTIGSEATELGHNTDETRRQITLERPFYISIFPLTVGQFKRLQSDTDRGYKFAFLTRPITNISYTDLRGNNKGKNWPKSGYEVDKDSYIDILRKRFDGRLLFDLPTETQWEIACRAGSDTAWGNKKDISGIKRCGNLDEIGVYKWNYEEEEGVAAEVGSKEPNEWGVYDMHGNVYEWCLDWYVSNPAALRAPAKCGKYRVIRGGSYLSDAFVCRSAWRGNAAPDERHDNLGVRLVINL